MAGQQGGLAPGVTSGASPPAAPRASTKAKAKGLVPPEVLAGLGVVATLERLGAGVRRTRDEDAQLHRSGRLKGQPRPTWWLDLPGDSRALKLVEEVLPPIPDSAWKYERRLWAVTDATGERVAAGAGATRAATELLGLSFGEVVTELGLKLRAGGTAPHQEQPEWTR